ncbi:MAG TPA: outer membrane beta-barrel protein [Bacteroidia bacterium]|nr:outer membrane beta-barrel protein [Bacteroidia bacterium]
MNQLRQNKISLLVTLLFLITSQVFAQNKNEFYIEVGYSQASQSPTIFNLFKTSFWRENIHNGYFSAEYYRNINAESAVGTGIQLVEKGFKNAYGISTPQLAIYQRYFFKLDYIEMPLVYRKKIASFFFNVGVLNSYLVKSAVGTASITKYANGKIQDFRGTSYEPNSFNKFDIGLIMRIDKEIRRNVFFTFSFMRGLIRPYIYNSGELNYNEVFLVGLKYKIN